VEGEIMKRILIEFALILLAVALIFWALGWLG
jgi:hypothetical protein